ncbi:LPS-assembly protein LptD [Chelativorans sp. AA-79]|uniref:LPS-assembly protein LptD n=1 Tax=Chelativorans sp. AA-79 TaxID=3028735 RepID=UPI0023F989AF|nr:LPS-assembly protein LptD [Chelativorans sp. AA-79]WEX07618.1 LPS-assembly protein LptD [Chelativorans sp. AA-79]
MTTGVAIIAIVAVASVAAAQVAGIDESDLPQDAQMLLAADTLVYDNDRNTITAVGGVQIEYGGYRVVAQRVTYDRTTSRVIGSGNVEIIDQDGNRYHADEIDLTDDLGEGFIRALRVETIEKTYFGAESAEREGGRITTFNKGVYTACEPCEENPNRPPLWQIKAQKIIWNGERKTVRFQNARFEMFGLPIAYLPFFEVADPTVERKSGFLMPSVLGGSERGYGLKVPYYFALSPTFDLTVSVTGYTKQGFLGEAEWRQQFNNGQYNLRIAGIRQRNPEEWATTEVDGNETDRGMVASKGDFQINPRWSTGWNIMVQSDKNFSRSYDIEGYSEAVHRSEVYLTGLDDRNYFDLRGYRFQVQESAVTGGRNDAQPLVLPNLDYSYTPDRSVAGGELTIDVNAQSLYRDEGMYGTKLQGLEGNSGRFTTEAEWRRSFVTSAGLVVTPILHARGDSIFTDYSQNAVGQIQSFTINGMTTESEVRSAYYRSMATAGIEARWPILFSAAGSAHIIEPMAQLFARPDEPYHDRLGIPNEDAQSLVFDATTLFERDKFSGYDRIEGGTRANLGIRYSGSFANGWTAHGLFGQSYQLAGDNPYDSPDLVNVGAYSGLETDVSDYVGLVGVSLPNGLAFSTGVRLDEETFDLKRADVRAGGAVGPVTANLQYAFIESQPLYGFDEDRQEVSGHASIRFHQNWRGFASGTFDIESRTLVKNSFGFAYDDECFTYLMSFSQERDGVTGERENSFGFTISLRTLGDFGSSSAGLSSFTAQ